MSDLPGDEWKHPRAQTPRGPSRAAEQQKINALYALNKVSHEEWSKQTDDLSNIHIWNADGKI